MGSTKPAERRYTNEHEVRLVRQPRLSRKKGEEQLGDVEDVTVRMVSWRCGQRG